MAATTMIIMLMGYSTIRILVRTRGELDEKESLNDYC